MHIAHNAVEIYGPHQARYSGTGVYELTCVWVHAAFIATHWMNISFKWVQQKAIYIQKEKCTQYIVLEVSRGRHKHATSLILWCRHLLCIPPLICLNFESAYVVVHTFSNSCENIEKQRC